MVLQSQIAILLRWNTLSNHKNYQIFSDSGEAFTRCSSTPVANWEGRYRSKFQVPKIRLFGQICFSVLDRLPFLTNLPVNHDGLSLGVMAQHPPWALLLRAFDVLKRHDPTDGGCGRKRLKGPGFDPSRAPRPNAEPPNVRRDRGTPPKKAHGAPPLAEGKGRSCYTPTSLESGGAGLKGAHFWSFREKHPI